MLIDILQGPEDFKEVRNSPGGTIFRKKIETDFRAAALWFASFVTFPKKLVEAERTTLQILPLIYFFPLPNNYVLYGEPDTSVQLFYTETNMRRNNAGRRWSKHFAVLFVH